MKTTRPATAGLSFGLSLHNGFSLIPVFGLAPQVLPDREPGFIQTAFSVSITWIFCTGTVTFTKRIKRPEGSRFILPDLARPGTFKMQDLAERRHG
jgi:hypothetical protein